MQMKYLNIYFYRYISCIKYKFNIFKCIRHILIMLITVYFQGIQNSKFK